VSLEAAVARATGSGVRALRRAGGGDINEAYLAELEDGRRAFVKTRPGAPAGEYAAEAAALRWLGEPGGLGVPAVLGVSDELLALEWLEEGRAGDAAELGGGLARVHAAGAERFGGAGPLRIGRIELPNEPLDDWPRFYAERRLAPLVGPAREGGALSAAGAEAVERVCERIADLAGPPEPPARLHGDLWSGNVLWSDGRPYLIDPIAYGGHREGSTSRCCGCSARPARASSPPTRRWRRSRTATRTASPSTSCSRCSCTRCCSAAATGRRPSAPPAGTLARWTWRSAGGWRW
jgi:fructosamine-3-kinase